MSPLVACHIHKLEVSLVAQWLNCSTAVKTLLMICVQSQRIQRASSRLTQPSLVQRSAK